MNILILSGTYPNKNDLISNIFVHHQVKALAEKNNVVVLEVDMRSIRKKRKLGFSRYSYEGVEVYRVAVPCGPIPFVLEFLTIVASWYGFIKVIKEFGKPTIIHAHFLQIGIGAVLIKKIYKTPFIITEHSSMFFKKKLPLVFNLISKYTYFHAEYIIAVGNVLKNKMTEITKKPISIIPNILPKQFAILQTPKYTSFTFISVGRLVKSKRFDLTIRAFEKFYSEHKDSSLIIVGEGTIRKELQDMVESLGLRKVVEFKGEIHNSELPNLYNKCHCFLLPSDFETFGVVYAEAIACGIPAIATKCGGPEDIILDQNGLLVERNNEEELYRAMEYIYDNVSKYNPFIVAETVKSRFSEQVITDSLMKVYGDAVE